jgi:hypothetical protein
VVITSGNRATIWKVGWSGADGAERPNDFLHWQIILWAKRSGYRYFDFTSIDPVVVECVNRKDALSTELIKTPSYFKTGFGGELIRLPEPAIYFPSPLLRLAYRVAASPMLAPSLSRVTRQVAA